MLSYLSRNRNDKSIYGKKIADDIAANQGSISMLLKDFRELGILNSENIGKTIVYKVNEDNPITKSFRVFENLLEINDLVQIIKPYSRKIILFGSCARGEDTSISDIDLFVVADSDNQEHIREKISNYEIGRQINPVIVGTLELIELEENDKVFIKEIYSGIQLGGGNIE